MKIVSGFHDFYDTSSKHGIDPSLVYLRSRKEITAVAEPLVKEFFERAPSRRNYGHNTLTVIPGVVLFCGEQAPFLHVTVKIEVRITTSVHTFALEEFERFALPGLHLQEIDSYMKNRGKARESVFWRNITRENVSEFFSGNPLPGERVEEIHARYNVPVAEISEAEAGAATFTKKLVLNPCLKDREFFKVKNPFAAFQEISGYIGGVLGSSGNPMAKVSDEVRAYKHGMDKTSFRTPSPGDRKARRRGTTAG